MNQPKNTIAFLRHLASENTPFLLRRNAPGPDFQDRHLHAAVYDIAPDLYALCGFADARPEQQARILFQVLAHSRVGVSAGVRQMLDRVTAQLLIALEPNQVLAVFLALRRARANHKHTRRAILRYVLNHPRLEELAVQRRPALVDCLEHALGKNVARACARLDDDNYLRRNLLRFAQDPARARKVLAFLYRRGELIVKPVVTESPAPARVELPRTITATNRGDIAATLVHIYRGGSNPELMAALERYVQEAASKMPRFDGTLALVLDASASTRGYGEREFCCISQSHAFRLVLEKCCAKLNVIQVGGAGNPPKPEGDTDLAMGVLDALDTNPDVVAIVSDGYENHSQGDLARVVKNLPVETPVVFCHSKFSSKDDLDLRKPAPLPELEFWHENDFAEVAWYLFAHARRPQGEMFIRSELSKRLARLEEEQSCSK